MYNYKNIDVLITDYLTALDKEKEYKRQYRQLKKEKVCNIQELREISYLLHSAKLKATLAIETIDFITDQQPIVMDLLPIFKYFEDNHGSFFGLAYSCYNLGFILGQREERTKRKH